MPMRIDIAAHVLPTRYFARLQQIPGFYMAKRVKGIPCHYDLDVRLRIMDCFADCRQVLSLASPPMDLHGSPQATPHLARLAKDELVGVVVAHSARFAAASGSLP